MRQYIDLIERARLSRCLRRLRSVGRMHVRLGDGHNCHQIAFALAARRCRRRRPLLLLVSGFDLHNGRGEQSIRLQRAVVGQLLAGQLRQILIGQQPARGRRLNGPLDRRRRGIARPIAGRQTVLRAAHAAADGAAAAAHAGSQGAQRGPATEGNKVKQRIV